jgi:LSD1 subclass zinc finger protein
MENTANTGNGLAHSEIGCPQCGAPVRLPHNADFIRCASCKSTLVLAQGVLTHVLRERVCVTREQATGILEAWLDKQAYASTVPPTVGELLFFPFVRIQREDEEHVAPLGALPSPAVAQLPYAPTELVETSDPVDGIDQAALGAVIGAALADPKTKGVQVEVRGYYPARYAVSQEVPTRFSAVIGAGQGPVYPDTLPPRSGGSVGRLQWYLLGLAVLLVAEAAAVPGLWTALLAIVATATVFCAIGYVTGFSRE